MYYQLNLERFILPHGEFLLMNIIIDRVFFKIFSGREGFMENKDLNKTIRCNSCNAEVPEGTKFCTECGEVIENYFSK